VLALNNLWVLPIQILIAMVLLFQEVSFAMFAGLSAITIILLANHYISVLQKAASDRTMIWKDNRMKLTSEVFGSILVVKLNAWEDDFYEKILGLRREELKHIWTSLFIAAINICLLWMAPCVVSVSTITVYTKYLHDDVSAAKIFTALALFRMLQDPLRQLPTCITNLFQALTSVERIDKFYALREKVMTNSHETKAIPRGAIYFPEDRFTWYDVSVDEKVKVDMLQLPHHNSLLSMFNIFGKEVVQPRRQQYAALADESSHGDIELQVSHAHTSPLHIDVDPLKDSKFSLNLSSLEIQAGDLVIIYGSVGSGKSTLLAAILGEMYSRSQSNFMNEMTSIAYASQQAWIQNLSVQGNILFGNDFYRHRYERVVDACSLHQDFLELPAYDRTEIGEKGLNLSGGQKARIALARAVYADTDAVLLDDILAALDPMVSRSIFDKCILELLGSKTRLLVTHNEELLNHPAVDMTIHLEKNQIVVQRLKTREQSLTSSGIKSVDSVPYSVLKRYRSADEIAGYFEDNREVVVPTITESPKSLSKHRMNLSFNGRLDKTLENSETPFVSPSGTSSSGKLTGEEDREEGRINAKVYMSYINAMGGWRVICALVIIQSTWQCLSVGSDLYLSYWSKESAQQQQSNLNENIAIYATLSLGSGLVVLARTMVVSSAGYRAGKQMFESMLSSLIHAPMHWLDRNPSGRLLNRMGDDQAKVDSNLPFAFGSIFATGFSVAGDLIAVMGITRYLILVMIPIGYVYLALTETYLKASREIQRLQSMSQSPLITLIAEVSDGIMVIRAFGAESVQRLIIRNQSLIDANSAMAHLAMASSCWFTLRIQLIGTLILAFIVILAFLSRSFVSAGLLGLSISYGLSVSNSLQMLVMMFAWFENSMVCPERIQQYIDVSPEGTADQDLYHDVINLPGAEAGDRLPRLGVTQGSMNGWPSQGKIVFDHVRFRYQPGTSCFIDEFV
jgi:ABC-type multidrug transport system fused ATPase/permease subunit